jgi:hypothetical protein
MEEDFALFLRFSLRRRFGIFNLLRHYLESNAFFGLSLCRNDRYSFFVLERYIFLKFTFQKCRINLGKN